MVDHRRADAPHRQFLPLLFLLFVGSGCAALIYEIVWFQLLQLVIGSSAISLGLLLATFMGGMCLGSLLLPRCLSVEHHPLRVYAALELGIAVLGIAVLLVVPRIGGLYALAGVQGVTSIVLRGVVCAICLLPPTILMGATLPAIARWVEATPSGISWLGFFYAGNIAGAVAGCLLAGFYLLRVHDMVVATAVAVAINVAVALCGLFLAGFAAHRTNTTQPSRGNEAPSPAARGARTVYLAIALSGASALGAEIVWTRLLSLMLGPTVYTFSIILAVFLIGLGIGSTVGSFLARDAQRPRLALGICQLLLMAAIAWSAHAIARSLPYWPINPDLSNDSWINFQLDVIRVLWAVLPAACLWGASFPLALASVADPETDPGHIVGRVYAANTVGAILGALGFGLPLVAWFGTRHSQQILILLAALSAALMLVFQHSGETQIATRQRRTSTAWFARLTSIAFVAAIASWFVWTLPGVPWELIAFGRFMATRHFVRQDDGMLHDTQQEPIFVGEGVNATVAVTKFFNSPIRHFHVAGKVEASSESADMRLQRMLGHIPALIHPSPRSVLIVGCGAGVTAGSFIPYPDIERIVICEIEPLIPREVATRFAEENHHVLSDPRVEVVIDDARHFLLTTGEKFDIITSDPIHPWVKGAAALYTQEYFELVKRHLNPGGVVTQWVPLYESSMSVVKSEIATFFAVFPNGTIWSNDIFGQGYDTVLLGRADDGPQTIDVAHLMQRLARADYLPVVQSLASVGFISNVGLLTTYAGRAKDLAPWLENAQINRDRDLRLQYLAGMGVNTHQDTRILNSILEYCQYPKDLFVGAGDYEAELRAALDHLDTPGD